MWHRCVLYLSRIKTHPFFICICEILKYSLRCEWSKLTVMAIVLSLSLLSFKQKVHRTIKSWTWLFKRSERLFSDLAASWKRLSALRRKWFQRTFCRKNLVKKCWLFFYFIIYILIAAWQLFFLVSNIFLFSLDFFSFLTL